MNTRPSSPVPAPVPKPTLSQSLTVFVCLLIGASMQAYFWLSVLILTILELSKRKIIGPTPSLSALSPWLLVQNSAPLLIAGLALHLACLIFLCIDSIKRPSPTLLFGWGAGAGAAAGFASMVSSTGYQSLYQMPWAMFIGLAAALGVLIGTPFVYVHLARNPNTTNRQMIWLQIPLLAFSLLLLFPVALWLLSRMGRQDLFSLRIWTFIGFPPTALFLNLLALAFTRKRHQRLLKASRLNHCHHCDYNLTGLPTTNRTTCPECGGPLPSHLITPPNHLT